MSAAAKIPARMSVAEFLAWSAAREGHWQLIDGEPRAMAPASRTHGALQGELASVIHNHLRATGSECSLIVAPGIVPRAMSRRNIRIPDLAVTCTAYETEEQALTDPVLIVEILSPTNEADTWANVWAYATIPSVREILVLQNLRIGAELLRRGPDGVWPESTDPIDDGMLTLGSIGLTLRLADIYATTRLARTGR